MNEQISLLEAMKHCLGTTSYILSLILGVVVFTVGLTYLIKDSRGGAWDGGKNFVVFLLLAILVAAVLYRPLQISANTTKEQAARGVYIGY